MAKKYKGHTKIELKNVITGKTDIIEKDNLITDKLSNLYKDNPFGCVSSTLSPSQLLCGIALYKDTLNLSSSNINMTKIPDAWAGVNASDGTSTKQGSAVLANTECGDNYIKYQWEWDVSQGNGTYSSVVLTNPFITSSGDFGSRAKILMADGETTYSVDVMHDMNEINYASSRPLKYENNNNILVQPYNNTDLNGNSLLDTLIYDVDDDYMKNIQIYADSDYSNWYIKLIKVKKGTKQIGLSQTNHRFFTNSINNAFTGENFRILEQSTSTVNNFFANKYHYQGTFPASIYYNKSNHLIYIITFTNTGTQVEWDTCNSLRWLTIDDSDISNPIISDITTLDYSGVLNADTKDTYGTSFQTWGDGYDFWGLNLFPIKLPYAYIFTTNEYKNNPLCLVKVNLNDPTVFEKIDTSNCDSYFTNNLTLKKSTTYYRTGFFVNDDLFICPNYSQYDYRGWLFSIEDEKLYNADIEQHLFTTMHSADYLSIDDNFVLINNRRNYQSSILLNPFYYGTINNFDTWTKSASQTMTITYTITETDS